MLRATAASAVVVALAAGCSSSGSGPTAAAPSADAGVLPSAHVHAVAIDPGDGALLLDTHEGLLEVGADGELAPTGPVIDLMGFTVVGPDHYLASGHPGLRVDLPQPVGLIETTDGGRSWTPLSRQGESDFHALTAGDAGILGFDGALRRSADGRTWEQSTIPAEPHTLSAAPDGTTVLATTAAGLLRSADAGTSWSPVAGAPLLHVVTWAGDGSTAAGVDPGGTLWTSSDAGSSWQERAAVGVAPNAVAADADASRIVVVTEAGLLESADGGVTFTPRLAP
ncbi:F510_1955 family glycosylhydrolase [Blastococcus saxobsidens]|uniref:Exo-alpha-sialidase n=1 Tax=Blastococcus saxobsidens TaxID=138336 RepID=A0A4Q7Y1Y6_9ACTN|nr:exo-alpha-sialidase [Blastococcus saxobsidens]RZU30807.1 hypothetical protein BKA19_0435 [Blastococcus saxobsidens]